MGGHPWMGRTFIFAFALQGCLLVPVSVILFSDVSGYDDDDAESEMKRSSGTHDDDDDYSIEALYTQRTDQSDNCGVQHTNKRNCLLGQCGGYSVSMIYT